MENRISRLLHCCHVGMLQGRWPLWKAGLLSELKTMDLVSILVSFIFLLFSLIFHGRVEDEENKVGYHHRSHDTVTEVTCSHDMEKQYR